GAPPLAVRPRRRQHTGERGGERRPVLRRQADVADPPAPGDAVEELGEAEHLQRREEPRRGRGTARVAGVAPIGSRIVAGRDVAGKERARRAGGAGGGAGGPRGPGGNRGAAAATRSRLRGLAGAAPPPARVR